MDNIYIRQVENLAESILASEQAKDYADAWANFEAAPDDEARRAEFIKLRAEYMELAGAVIAMLRDALGVRGGGCGGGCGK